MIVNETLQTIKQRRSIRSYQDKQVTDEEIQAIVEAATAIAAPARKPNLITLIK